MTKLIVELRDKFAGQEKASPLEYALAAVFVVMALLAAIPGLAPALTTAFSRVFLRFA